MVETVVIVVVVVMVVVMVVMREMGAKMKMRVIQVVEAPAHYPNLARRKN